MAITERKRRDIFNGFESTYGEELASTIMELLPNQPADHLVTRTDMHAFGTGLRGEMAELRGELKGEMAEVRAELKGEMTQLRGEMAELRAELRGEMTQLRGELTAETAELRSDMVERFSAAKVETQRLIGLSMAGNTIAVVTALLT